MSRLRAWLVRLWGTFHHAPSDAEMEEELQLHLSLLADDLTHQGLSPAEAGRVARTQAGGVPQAMDRRRDQRGLRGSRTWARTFATACAFCAARRCSVRSRSSP